MKAVASKASIFLFLLYSFWYRSAYRYVSLFLYGGAILVVITTAIYVNHRTMSCLIPPKGILFWVGFGVYSLLTGLVVATDRGLLVSSIVTYMAFMLVCWCICIVCQGENDIKWLLKCIAIVCHVCAIYTVFFGKQSGIYAITMGPDDNPNSLGVLMVYGLFSVLYNKKRKVGELLGMLASTMLFFYVIILSCSRKSLLSGALLCLVWLIAFVRDTHKHANRREKSMKYALLLITLAIGGIYFVKYYANTNSFERLQFLGSDGSTHLRLEMYKEGWEFFKSSKLFGIGYKQYMVHSSYGAYAHSTYAEVLACSGIFGCILFFYPIMKTGLAIVKKLRRNPSYQKGMLLSLFLVEMFLATGVIFMYSLDDLIIWSILYMTTENTSLIDMENHNRGEKLCRK